MASESANPTPAPHFCAVVQITVSSVKLSPSLTAVGCCNAARERERLPACQSWQLAVCAASKEFITDKLQSVLRCWRYHHAAGGVTTIFSQQVHCHGHSVTETRFLSLSLRSQTTVQLDTNPEHLYHASILPRQRNFKD